MRPGWPLALYSTVLRLATPAYLLRLRWRARQEPGYGRHGLQRLGWGQPGPGASTEPPLIWLHAVSLGETRAAGPLLQALRRLRPGWRVLLTHGTATGRAEGERCLQPGDLQAWLPWDTPGAVRRFLDHHRPALGVVMETEVWPNLLRATRERGVPMVLANARLSERSAARGRRWAPLLRPALAAFDAVLAQTEADAQRLRASGARTVHVMGNLKFDLSPDPALLAAGQRWRAALGRPVVLAAVTREGEESALLQAWTALPPPRPLLLVVPRHPQRFGAVLALMQQAGLASWARSAGPAPGDALPPAALAAQAWLGDSLGEMALYYGLADVALLGGSFEPLGGQNLIEAAACGCPLLMGPHTFNFAQAAEGALAAGAALRVQDLPGAVTQALAWLGERPGVDAEGDGVVIGADAGRGVSWADAGRRVSGADGRTPAADTLGRMASAGRAFAAAHRGAADRMAAAAVALARVDATPREAG